MVAPGEVQGLTAVRVSGAEVAAQWRPTAGADSYDVEVEPAYEKLSEVSLPGAQNAGSLLVNGGAHTHDALVTHAGWQYAGYYTVDGSDPAVRRVTLARRQLPAGAWESFQFTDYAQTSDDAHNVVALGVAPSDGTLHLAFDHHVSQLKRRQSTADILTDPASHTWGPALFGAIQNSLDAGSVTGVTYPSWFTSPSGRLYLAFRVGGSSSGAYHLYEYDSGVWVNRGVIIDGTGGTPTKAPYPQGWDCDASGRLHVTWVWRETGDVATNHDLSYLYSDDRGVTWRRNDGTAVTLPVTPASAGVRVWEIPQGSGLSNHEGQDIADDGTVHVLARDQIDDGVDRYVHYRRNLAGVWTRRALLSWPYSGRGKLLTTPGGAVVAAAGRVRLLQASAPARHGDWQLTSDEDHPRFDEPPLVDRARLGYDGVLSVLAKKSAGNALVALDYRLAARTSVAATSALLTTARAGGASVRVRAVNADGAGPWALVAASQESRVSLRGGHRCRRFRLQGGAWVPL